MLFLTGGDNKAVAYRLPLPLHTEFEYLSLPRLYVCTNTNYCANISHHNLTKTISMADDVQRHTFKDYRPVHFDRFRYLGKGFKLIFKKKTRLFNCVFGYSHIYWIKLQSMFVKKTKKYKFFFSHSNPNLVSKLIKILKMVKPINRYTLRGLRTYQHVWIKRKGRKSVATHV